MYTIYIQSTPISIFNSGFEYQDTIKFENFGPGLRISLYGNKSNDDNIYGYTLDAHEEEYKYKYEEY